MAAPSIDKEFMQYWLKLTPDQKQSLLCLAKKYVEVQEAALEENKETGFALQPSADRKYLTQEEIDEEAEKWWRKCTGNLGQM